MIPPFVVQYIHLKHYSDDHYNNDVMTEAYSAFITLILVAALSYSFVHYFNISDCDYAHVKRIERTHQAIIDGHESLQLMIKATEQENVLNKNELERKNETL